ncbi:unnamed protein product [Gongylonema pulchrum]|uniref:Uncharacterized protein n=1 Tax=Gongylonema pulchrum TaxID=637853 RepID=A0A183EFW9_9BILA|nr:unnamed protein product [Gongylonema pulchrum]
MPVTDVPTYTANITRLTTTSFYPPFDVNIHEIERRPEEDVAIEEVPTRTTVQSWTTTSIRPPPTSLTTEEPAPPTVFEEKRNIPFDVLLKPGVLAGK